LRAFNPQQAQEAAPEYITIKGDQYGTALTELDLSGKGLGDEDIDSGEWQFTPRDFNRREIYKHRIYRSRRLFILP